MERIFLGKFSLQYPAQRSSQTVNTWRGRFEQDDNSFMWFMLNECLDIST